MVLLKLPEAASALQEENVRGDRIADFADLMRQAFQLLPLSARVRIVSSCTPFS